MDKPAMLDMPPSSASLSATATVDHFLETAPEFIVGQLGIDIRKLHENNVRVLGYAYDEFLKR